MKFVFHTVILFLFSVLQPTWIGKIACFGIIPNLFLIYIVLVSSYSEKKEGLILGFVAGLILDLFVGKIIGINAVLMMTLAFFVNTFYANVLGRNTLLISLAVVAIITPIYELVYYIVAFLGDLHLKSIFLKVLLPECLSSVVATFPLYFIVKKYAKVFWKDKGEEIG